MTPFPASGKIKVTPEQSRKVIDSLLEQGNKWWASGGDVIANHEYPYIVWDAGYFDNLQSEYVYKDCQFPEYPFSIFESEGEDEWEEIRKGLRGAYVTESYTDHLIQQWKSKYKIQRLWRRNR